MKLTNSGMLRTALDEVLRGLRQNPDDFFLLQLGATIAGTSRTANLRSTEPTTSAQRRSALLAPVATECSSCDRFWYPLHWASPSSDGIDFLMNPSGLQCEKCLYTLCRYCLKEHGELPQPDPIDRPQGIMVGCPKLGHGVLDTPVHATGRSDVTSIKPNRIEAVIFIRDGPIRPSMDEALEVIPRFAPLIANDSTLIYIRPSKPGLMAEKSGRDELALARIHELERDGLLAQNAWSRSELIHAKIHDVSAASYLLIVVGKSDTSTLRGTAERGFILHGGKELGADEVGKIIHKFEQDTGIDLCGVRMTSCGGGGGEPDENIAKFLILQLESEGEVSAGALQRTIVTPIRVNEKLRIVAVVLTRN